MAPHSHFPPEVQEVISFLPLSPFREWKGPIPSGKGMGLESEMIDLTWGLVLIDPKQSGYLLQTVRLHEP